MSKIYLLNNLKYEGIENLEVFGIEYLESAIDLSIYDALVFTSKNAIYSIDSFNKSWKTIPSYAIAPKTAKIIKDHGGNLIFTGVSSHGNEFAKELSCLLKNKKVLYIRALKTVSNISNILKENDIDVDELIAYKTSCKKSTKILEEGSVFIFSAPSSVECFFKNYKWSDTYTAIAIGKTTAKYLPSNIKYYVSEKTSIDECIKLAKQHLL
ncbi:uroporphyrinogen-III synthase [Poseidonibacter antarcticus]|uniref:uroporphyrinogen-III synthase n=1 Tax=Poseidonibacter antarcticus TaxID=2478538 RepID=UPI000EF4C6BC|nr:uroporphyrinogen-III synthase [Poseidonibacter antarcticus]